MKRKHHKVFMTCHGKNGKLDAIELTEKFPNIYEIEFKLDDEKSLIVSVSNSSGLNEDKLSIRSERQISIEPVSSNELLLDTESPSEFLKKVNEYSEKIKVESEK